MKLGDRVEVAFELTPSVDEFFIDTCTAKESSMSYVQFSTSSFPQPVLHTRNPVLQTMTHLSHTHGQYSTLVQFYTLVENSTNLGF